ncbi:MAG: LysR family transcriptional regulator [Acutalibacter sp.]|jgi:DNA-binding transcriptional LysR family regulator
MDTKQLAYFVAAAKYRNFSRAAEEFYLSQPAISHQIKMLERELDTELFVRNTKKVTLTESGALFLEDAKAILDSIEQAKQKLAAARHQPAMLRICHLPAATHDFLSDIVNQFHLQHPYVKIRLIRQDAYGISESVARRDADIYFSIMSDLMKYPSLEIQKIQTDSLCLVTRKDHPALQQPALDFQQLAKEPFLVFHPNHARYMNKRIAELCAKLGFHPQVTEQYDLYEDLLQAVESGTGISILPYRSHNYMQTNHLAFTLLDDSSKDLNVAVAWEHQITNPAVPGFLDVVQNYVRDHPEMI